MTLVLGLVCIGLALALGCYTVLAGKPATAVAEVAVPAPSPVPFAVAQPDKPSLISRFGTLAAAMMPGDYAVRVQHRLDLAGNPASWSAERLLAVKGIGVVAGTLLGLVIGAKHNGGLAILFALVFGAVGLFVPDLIVRNLGEKRQIDLQRQLPDAMDMLLVCVEAGMGFDAAVARVSRNSSGPVAEEFARVLQEMQFGMSRSEALRALVARTDVAELRAFVAAMVQSSELGISIGDVLREQAHQMRIRRRQRAEEKAHKLQVKLLLPLITCLLPAIFVVVLGPALIHLAQFFSAAN
jgi:tight adherence protein C